MSIRSRLPRASVAKGPPGISFHSSEAADHLNCTRVSTGHWCGTGLKKAHLTVRVSLARLLLVHSAAWFCYAGQEGMVVVAPFQRWVGSCS